MRLLALAILLLSAPLAAAQPANPPTPEALASAYRCTEIQEDASRLACYDQAIGRLRQAESQGQIVAIDRERAADLRRESFGFNLPNLARLIPGGDSEVARIEMQVDRIDELAFGRHSFVMSNGQIWTQVEPRNVTNIRPGDTVTVRQAALGSFMLSARHGAGYRVRRQN